MREQKYQFLAGDNGKPYLAGFGSYGEVKIAKNLETGQVVAIKIIYNKNAKDQIDVHHKLNHPNIIKMLNYNYDKQKNNTYMILEFAQNGTLSQKIKYGLGQLSKSLIRKYFRDVCEAVKYVHSNGFMHRDIKPQNILLTKDNHAKLCDFGFAAIVQYRSTLCGTYEYMSPEMIQKKPYDYKIDIWALGILLFQMINGSAPFKGDSGEQVINEMKKPIIFCSRFQPEEIDLIRKILRVNAQNRPKVQQILQHPYFKRQITDDSQLSKTIEQQPFKKKQIIEKEQKQTKQPFKYNKREKTLTDQFKKQLHAETEHHPHEFKPYLSSQSNSTKKIYSNSISYNQSHMPTTNFLQPQNNSGSFNMGEPHNYQLQNSLGYKNISNNNSTSSLLKSNSQSINQQYPTNANFIPNSMEHYYKNPNQTYYYGQGHYGGNFKKI